MNVEENGALIRHRISVLEQHIEKIDAKIDKLVEQVSRAIAVPHCPKPGMCIDLEKVQIRHAEEISKINQSISYFKGAIWSAGVLGGALGTAGSIAINISMR